MSNITATSRLSLDDLGERLFQAEDTVCLERARLAAEGWARHEHEPRPILRARVLEHVLRNMTLDLKTNPVFAGNTSSRPRAWMLLPEYSPAPEDGQIAIEHEQLKGFLKKHVPADVLEFWKGRSSGERGILGGGGNGHICIDLEVVVHAGLAAILDRIRQKQHDSATPAQQRDYLEAMRISLTAVIAWANRYADAASEAAASQQDPFLRGCYQRVAMACRQVPERPARDLFEGLQSIALVQLALAIEGQVWSVSIGSPDRVLARFNDEAQRDPQGTADLVGAFLLKIASNSIFGRGSKTQAITIGGADEQGRDCCNAITMAFLDALERVPVADPHLFLRWHPALDEQVRDKACRMLSRRRSMPLLVNDATTVRGLIRLGIAPPDAWNYCIIGCNELGIPGRLFDTATPIHASYNDLRLVNRLLLETPEDELDALDGVDAIQRRLEAIYTAHSRDVLPRRAETKQQMAEAMPCPLTSALMTGGAERATDYMIEMPYQTPGIYTRGLANAACALAAIETLVFDRHEYSLSGLVQAMRDNLTDENLRGRLLQSPKWAADNEIADTWALRLIDIRNRAVSLVEEEFGLAKHAVCHVVRSLHHMDGRGIGASLDGRRAGEPVGDSIGALFGSAASGPTVTLTSVAKIDAGRDFAGGYNLNLTLDPAHAGTSTIRALIEGFFDAGGQELQINVLDAATLRDARTHPERHRDLVVRVAGLCARFVELSATEQLELIARAEAAQARR